MKPSSIHKIQINTQRIHSVSIQKKQPTMLKITSIHFKNKILLHFLQILHIPNNRVPLHIFKELTPNASSPGSKTKKNSFTCSSDNLARLALTMCPALEKLRCHVALLPRMQRYFWAACAVIGYLRDAWGQYSREDVSGGEFIRSEWKSFTSHSILRFPSSDNGLPLAVESMYPSHTRSRSTETWTGASQESRGSDLLPSGSSPSPSSSLDVNKCLPPLLVLIAFSLCSPGLGAYGLQGLPGCQPEAWAIFWHTHDNSLLNSSITPAHSKSPSFASLSLMTCCHMIWSTLICSLKLSSQSKWRQPTANAPKNYVSAFICRTTNVPYPWLFMGYSLHKRQYWVGSTFTMLCTTLCCVERRACGVNALCRAIRQNVGNRTQIVCAIKLTGRPTVLLNVARHSQNISSTWRHILHEAVQTYDVEMTCQRFMYSVSVTNNHVEPEVQALHIALWLKNNRITCCTIDFQGITANTRQKYEVHIKADKECNKQKYSPPMSKYAKNMRPNKGAPSFFNSSLNL